MEGDGKREKSGYERKSEDTRDVTDFMYLENLKELLLWSLTHR